MIMTPESKKKAANLFSKFLCVKSNDNKSSVLAFFASTFVIVSKQLSLESNTDWIYYWLR